MKIIKLFKKPLAIIFSLIVKNQCKKYNYPLKVMGYSKVNRNTELGKNVNFNGMIITGRGKVKIGDNFHSGKNCKMITQIHNYNGEAIPYDKKIINKDIIIGDNVWLGDDVMILGGVIIEEGAIIQARSVVVNDIPKYSIAGGHPAKVFSKRDIERYEKLKKQKKFH